MALLSFKRTKDDHVNGANLSAKKEKKRKRRKKLKDDIPQNNMIATAHVQATLEMNLSNDKKSDQAIGTGLKQTENDDDVNSISDSDVVLSDLATEGTRKSSRSRHPIAKAAGG